VSASKPILDELQELKQSCELMKTELEQKQSAQKQNPAPNSLVGKLLTALHKAKVLLDKLPHK